MKQVAARAPLVVVAHGSRGQGPTCAPSLDSDDARAVHPDYEQLVWPLVGLGYPVIASDWAGFSAFGAEGNPISGFGFVDDVGRSLLDSIAAAHDVAATVLTDDYVLVGHSQGGQLALGTLALSTSYGPDARFSLRGVAAYAPLWLPQRSWGAIPLIESTVPIGPSSAVPVAIWYHYTHGAILDGPDGALAMFREDKRAFLKEWVESSCWEIGFARLLEEGRVYSDFFAKDFIDAVSPTAGLGSPCPADDPSRALCETWMARYRADRPLATGTAQDVPVLVAIGGGDPAIPPDRLACVVDALRRSTRNVAFCFHRTADHGGIMRAHADAVADWIGSVTLGTPRTAQCESDVVDLTDGNGNAATCAVIPPNE
jgi:alpha-beta hydrolase superfamily lysophospholipase